jgi:hypothetical protein
LFLEPFNILLKELHILFFVWNAIFLHRHVTCSSISPKCHLLSEAFPNDPI